MVGINTVHVIHMHIDNRMKKCYEHPYRITLTKKTPVILRLDGKSFHTLTKRYCQRPFDQTLMSVMHDVATAVMDEAQGAKCAYIQSDEISILLTDYDKFDTCAWFDYNIQKMCSISAAVASVTFSKQFGQPGYFDARVFNVPKDDVVNYFVWRQGDWIRNSVMMAARSFYSQKELDGKSNRVVIEMMKADHDFNWYDMSDTIKYGQFLIRGGDDTPIVFNTNREVFNPWLENPML